MKSDIILGPDGQPAELPEPTPEHLVEFFAWETIGIPMDLHLEAERIKSRMLQESGVPAEVYGHSVAKAVFTTWEQLQLMREVIGSRPPAWPPDEPAAVSRKDEP